MKLIATPEQMRECDRVAIEDIGIPGIVLMESASRAVAEEVIKRLGVPLRGKKATIFCGKGNNGGDGLACARCLLNRGVDVSCILAAPEEDLKGDAQINAGLFRKTGGEIICIKSVEEIPPEILLADIVVDALLGTGFSGETTGLYRSLIELIGRMEAPVISVDIPSGVCGESGRIGGAAVRADATVTFGLLKPGLLLPPGRDYTGDVIVADIGIPTVAVERQGLRLFLVEAEDIREFLPRRARHAHKGDAGFVYILAGSPGLTGAAALAAEAAVRTGAGLVVVGIPRSLNPILEVKLTEAMTEPLPETPGGGLSYHAQEQVEARFAWMDSIAIGPGLGREPDTAALMERILPAISKPLVIDADGLNLLSTRPELISRLPRNSVLTPHPGELSRLTGVSATEIASHPIDFARRCAGNWQVYLHLKGSPSITATPKGDIYINPTGNPGMATGGSGDVLTGIIAALLAAGVQLPEAVWAGAYIHGLAGDKAVRKIGTLSLAASDIIRFLPDCLIELS